MLLPPAQIFRVLAWRVNNKMYLASPEEHIQNSRSPHTNVWAIVHIAKGEYEDLARVNTRQCSSPLLIHPRFSSTFTPTLHHAHPRRLPSHRPRPGSSSVTLGYSFTPSCCSERPHSPPSIIGWLNPLTKIAIHSYVIIVVFLLHSHYPFPESTPK